MSRSLGPDLVPDPDPFLVVLPRVTSFPVTPPRLLSSSLDDRRAEGAWVGSGRFGRDTTTKEGGPGRRDFFSPFDLKTSRERRVPSRGAYRKWVVGDGHERPQSGPLFTPRGLPPSTPPPTHRSPSTGPLPRSRLGLTVGVREVHPVPRRRPPVPSAGDEVHRGVAPGPARGPDGWTEDSLEGEE